MAENDDESRVFAWVTERCGGPILASTQTSGGNRARSWAMDLPTPGGDVAEVFLRYAAPRPPGVEPYTTHREAQVYRAIAGLDTRITIEGKDEHGRALEAVGTRLSGIIINRHSFIDFNDMWPVHDWAAMRRSHRA